MNQNERTGFEARLDELDAIIAKLMENKTELSEAVELYGRGMKLVDVCRNEIDNAERSLAAFMTETVE